MSWCIRAEKVLRASGWNGSIRASGFGFLSDLGFRTSDFGLKEMIHASERHAQQFKKDFRKLRVTLNRITGKMNNL